MTLLFLLMSVEVMVLSSVYTLENQARVLSQSNYVFAPYRQNQIHHAALQTLVLHQLLLAYLNYLSSHVPSC